MRRDQLHIESGLVVADGRQLLVPFE